METFLACSYVDALAHQAECITAFSREANDASNGPAHTMTDHTLSMELLYIMQSISMLSVDSMANPDHAFPAARPCAQHAAIEGARI